MKARDINMSGFEFQVVKVGVDESGNDIFIPVAMQKDPNLAVSMGMMPGYSVIDKFGVNPLTEVTTDPEDVWEGGGIYPYDTFGSAPIVSIASTDALDTQDISIQGLDINGDLVEQVATLTGTTRVALDTPLWRIFRMENLADEGGDIQGTVYAYIGTDVTPTPGDPEIRALISNGNNQTLMALYTIPKGKVGFLYRGEIGLEYTGTVGAGTNFAKCAYRSRRLGKVFKTKKQISLISAASSIIQDKRTFPDIIPALTDLKITIQEVSEDIGVWGTLDILLVDETLLSNEYLTAIGQPGY